MKVSRISLIVVLFLVQGVWLSRTVKAESMGTAFTYQGRLIESNDVADGLYDFQFKLFDSVSDGNQLNSDVDVTDLDVIDGYFTVELDFGSDPNTFNGYARWLDIGVRPGSSSGDFTTLSPRQKVTPTPYSLMAADVKAPLSVGGYNLDPIIKGINVYSEGVGVCGLAFGSNGQGVRGKNVVSEKAGSLGGNDYGVKSEGDLVVDGNDAAFRGTIGPNNGAPFPRPAYNSDWIVVTSSEPIILFHNIGGNVDNYVVDVQEFDLSPDWGIGSPMAQSYSNLTTNSVKLWPSGGDNSKIRVRIWVYN